MPREKPAVTIRLLRRQLATAQQTIMAIQLDRSDKEKVIAGYDVQLSEAQDALREAERRAAAAAYEATNLREFILDRSSELEFFRGYYAKSQEVASAGILSAGPLVASHPTEIDAGPSARDPQNLSAGRQRSQSAGIDQGPAGFGAGLGDPVRRQHPHDLSYPEGREMEHVEVKDGLSRGRPRGADWRA